jgi:dihydroneopterin aldolase
MNSIFVHDLRLTTRVGVYDWERVLPQTIRIDLDLELASGRVFESGDLVDGVDYATVVARIRVFAADHGHALLERFADALARLLLDEFALAVVKLRVAKLGAVRGVREIGVAIERRR